MGNLRVRTVILQGLMFGYATDETPECMPLTLMIAHRLNRRLHELRRNGTLSWVRPDSKSQVPVFDDKISHANLYAGDDRVQYRRRCVHSAAHSHCRHIDATQCRRHSATAAHRAYGEGSSKRTNKTHNALLLRSSSQRCPPISSTIKPSII